MKLLRGTVSIVLSMLMVLSLFTVVPVASALSGSIPGSSLTYSFDEGTGTLTISGTGAMPDFGTNMDQPWYAQRKNIKKLVVNEGVTSIGAINFMNLCFITEISLPQSLLSIGRMAFKNVGDVEEIVIPDGVVTIEDMAFASEDDNVIRYGQTKKIVLGANVETIGNAAFREQRHLEEVVFNNKLKTICNNAFFNNQVLATINLPDSLEEIQSEAFAGNMVVTNIHLGSGLKTIGDGAFSICSQLENVNIPASVENIGANPFSGISKAYNLDLDSNNTHFTYDGRALYNKEKTKLITFVGGGSYTVPEGVEIIGESAFNTSLVTKVNLPNSLKNIERRAFFACFKLADVLMGTKLETVGTEAFRGCALLSTIAFPLTVTTIGNSAFYGCTSLTSALILNDHVVIEEDAFAATGVGMTIKSTVDNGNLKAYAEENGFDYEKIEIVTPDPTEITSIVGRQYNEIRIQWRKIDTASGYIIYKSMDGGITYDFLDIIDDGNITTYSDYDVNINRLYYYKVAALVLVNNLQIISASSEAKSASTRLERTSVDREFTYVNYNTVHISWNSVPGADGYYIYTRLEHGDNPQFVMVKKELDHNYTDVTDLNTDMDTSIQVAAFRMSDDNREIAGDTGSGITVHPVLREINITKIEPYDFETIKIEWNAVPGAEEYRIDYSKNSNLSDSKTITVYDPSATSYLITNLDSFVQYFVRVRAIRSNVEGETQSRSGISAATPVLEEVASLSVKRIGLVNVEMNWPKVDGANGYRIYSKLGDNDWIEIYQASAEQSTYTVNDLLTDKEYQFKIEAYRINSDAVEVRSAACEAPNTVVTTFDPPVITEGKMTAFNKVSLAWNKSIGATGYEIWRSTDSGAYVLVGTRSEENEVNAVDTYYFNDTVETGSVYVYKIIGYYEAKAIVGYEKQYTEPSNLYTVKAIATTPVVTVTGRTYESISLDWQDIPEAMYYYIQWTTYEEAEENQWQTYQYACPFSEYTMHGLETNVTYYFRVYATNEEADSYSKCSVVVSDVPILNIPDNVATKVINYNDVKISWDEVEGASGYDVLRKAQGEESFGLLVRVDSQVLSYNDTDVITGIEYSYIVVAYRNIRNDLRYSENSVTVKAKPVLNPTIFVNGSTRAANYRTNKLAWNAVPGAIEYRIYRSIDDGQFVLYATLNSEKSSYEDNEAITGSKNSYYVISYRSDIATSTSDVVDLYPILEKAEITGSDVNSSESLTLYWEPVEGATAYDVYYATTEGGPYSTPLESVSTSYEVTGLRSNQTYYFYVVSKYAMNYYDMSTAYAEHSDIYQACINLVAPDNRVAAGTSTSSVNLKWNEVEEVAGYHIYRYNGSAWAEIGEVPAGYSSFNDNNLKAGTGYSYKICTYLMGMDGSSKVESAFGSFNPVATMPGKVTLTGAQTGEFNTVALEYSASNSAEKVNYVIQRKMGANGTYETIGTTEELTFNDTNAETGKIFIYRVVPSVTYEGYYIEGEASNEIEAKTILVSPVITSLTQADYNAATLVWNSTEGADGYIIYRSLNNDNTSWSEITRLEGNDTTTYTDNTLTCNVEYYFAVCPYRHSAVEGGDDYIGEIKNPSSITTRLDKGVITELISTGYKSIKLTWKKVNGAEGYRVYRSTNGKDFGMIKDITDTKVLTYTADDLVCGMTYYYKVCAYNKVGNKPVLGAESAAKAVTVLPSAPTVSSVKAISRTGIAIKWTKVDGADSYTVYRSEKSATSGFETIAETGENTFSYNDLNLKSGKTYYYTVKANRGKPPVRSLSNKGKGVSLIPDTPAITKVAGTAYNKLKITWATVSDCDGYVLYRSLKDDSGWVKVTSTENPKATTYTDTVSECGVTYYYTIKAFWNGGAYSKYNKGVGGHTTPSMPTIKTAASTGYKNIKLTWAAIKEANGYLIYRTEKTDGTGWKSIKDITSGTTVSYTDSTAETGKLYYYTIKSYVNVEGAKIQSSYDKKGKSAKAIPATPKISSAKQASVKSIKLTWSKIAGANGYLIYRSLKSKSDWTKIATIKSGTTVTYTDSNAVPGTQYYYTMKAYTTTDSGSIYSKYQTTGTAGKTTFTTPKISSAKATGFNAITLKWAKIAGADGYTLYRSVKSSGSWTKIGTAKSAATSYVDTTAVFNTQYYYTIKASCKVAGKTYTSNYVKTGTAGKITADALIPTFTLSSVGYNSIKIKWNPISDAGGYIVYRTEKSDGTGWKSIKNIKNNTTGAYTDSTAVCGKTYYYTVKPYKAISGKTVYGGYLKNGKSCVAIPATPEVTAVQQQDMTVLVEWNEIAGAQSYQVFRKPSGGKWTKIGTETEGVLVFMDEPVEAGVEYEYTVKAICNNTASKFTAVKMTMYVEPV